MPVAVYVRPATAANSSGKKLAVEYAQVLDLTVQGFFERSAAGARLFETTLVQRLSLCQHCRPATEFLVELTQIGTQISSDELVEHSARCEIHPAVLDRVVA
ncbi:hypothetical protein [Nocardia brasiliensis]|uniref:hypothetical protein n=1 Tax=Nocardia brasiliensis TaxID=37326 RepID=UPI002458D0D5|nr:hypothetical protein [Nocardia brasiliensis]